MKLHNEFEVALAPERVWETLLELERVARFLPGATIEPGDEHGVHRGKMKMRLGPMTVAYDGTARLANVDPDARVAEIEIKAQEAGGTGTVAATITNRLIPAGEGTRVLAETDLRITGRQAQFGRGIMQDVATRMLDQFADRFERDLLGDGAPADAVGASTGSAAEPDDDAVDVGALIGSLPAARAAAATAALAAVALLIVLLARRKRRSLELKVVHRW